MNNQEYKFNVYTADGSWTFIENFWALSDYNLCIGGYRVFSNKEMNYEYKRHVIVKRME